MASPALKSATMTRRAPYRTKEYGREDIPSLEKVSDGFEDIMMVPVDENRHANPRKVNAVSTPSPAGSIVGGLDNNDTPSLRETFSGFLDDTLPPPLSDDEQQPPPVPKKYQQQPKDRTKHKETKYANSSAGEDTSDNSAPEDLSKPDAIVTERKCLYRDYPHLKVSQFRRSSISDIPMRRSSSSGASSASVNSATVGGSANAGMKPRNSMMRRASMAGSTPSTAGYSPLQSPLATASPTMPSYSQLHLIEKEVEKMEENHAVMNMLSAMGNPVDFVHPLQQPPSPVVTAEDDHGGSSSSRSRRGSLVEGISALAEKISWNNDQSGRSRRGSMSNSSSKSSQQTGQDTRLQRYLGSDPTTASRKVNAALQKQGDHSPRSRSPPLTRNNNVNATNKYGMTSRMMDDSASSSASIITNMMEMDDIQLSTHHRRSSLTHHLSSSIPEDDTSDLTSTTSVGNDGDNDNGNVFQLNHIARIEVPWMSDVHDVAERVDRRMFILGVESPFLPVTEVIPTFGDMHRKMRSHLARHKVREIKEKRETPPREYTEESVMDTREVHLMPDIVPTQKGIKKGGKQKHQQKQHRLPSIASAALIRHSLNRFLDDQAFVGKYLYRKRKTTPTQFEGYVLPIVIATGLERRLDDHSRSVLTPVLEEMNKCATGYEQHVLHSDILTKFRRKIPETRSRIVRTALFENPLYDSDGIPEVSVALVDETKGVEHQQWLISQWNLLLTDRDDEERYEYKLYSSGDEREEYSPDEQGDDSSSSGSVIDQKEKSIVSSDDESDELQDLPTFGNRGEDSLNPQQMRSSLLHLHDDMSDSDDDSDGSQEFPWWQSPPTETTSSSPPTKAASLTLMDDDDSSSDEEEYPWSNFIPQEEDGAQMGIVEQTRKNLSEMKIGRMIQNQDQETKVALDRMSSHNRSNQFGNSAHGRSSIMEFFSSHKRTIPETTLESSEFTHRMGSNGAFEISGSRSLHNRSLSTQSFHNRRESRESTMAMHNSMHHSMHSNRRNFRTNPSISMSSNVIGLNSSTHNSQQRRGGSTHKRKGGGLETQSLHRSRGTSKHLSGSIGNSAHTRTLRRDSLEDHSGSSRGRNSTGTIDWLSDNIEDDDELGAVGLRRMARQNSAEEQALEASSSSLSPEKETTMEKRRGSLYEGPP